LLFTSLSRRLPHWRVVTDSWVRTAVCILIKLRQECHVTLSKSSRAKYWLRASKKTPDPLSAAEGRKGEYTRVSSVFCFDKFSFEHTCSLLRSLRSCSAVLCSLSRFVSLVVPVWFYVFKRLRRLDGTPSRQHVLVSVINIDVRTRDLDLHCGSK